MPMFQTMSSSTEGTISSITRPSAGTSKPAYQAYLILRMGFIAAFIVAGTDKFFHLLANWDMYLAPAIANLSPVGGHGLMSVVGVIEVLAGFLVAVRPHSNSESGTQGRAQALLFATPYVPGFGEGEFHHAK